MKWLWKSAADFNINIKKIVKNISSKLTSRPMSMFKIKKVAKANIIIEKTIIPVNMK